MRDLADNPKPAAGTFENIAGVRPAATVLRAVTLVGGIVYSSIPGLFGSVWNRNRKHTVTVKQILKEFVSRILVVSLR
jgi:hypothetical protein